MSGCFGGSAVDRWMEGNLNRYLDDQECTTSRVCSFTLRMGKKVIHEWDAEISDEDSPYWEMKETLLR